MPIEGQRPLIYTEDHAIVDIYKATATVYWPKYFDQWTIVLIESGYEEAEVYQAVDEARNKVKEKSKMKQRVEKADVIHLARLITRYYKDLHHLASETVQ